MADTGWDLSAFVTKYTSNSADMFSSPAKPVPQDLFDASMESENSPSQSKANQLNSSSDEFCTQKNIQDRLNFLNQELTLFGFDQILASTNGRSQQQNSVENLNLAKLVNCTYELLKRQHVQIKLKDELEERQMRSETDNEYLMQNQVRLKQDLENLKRECALLLCREKEQIEKCRVLTQDLKNEREEKRKLKSDVEHLKKQFYHESKRAERETSRLKEKVHQLLNDKSMDRKIGIDILNTLQRADGRRATWKTAGKKNDEEMYKMVISNYEDKEKKILHENQSLRETIGEVQNMLVSMDTSMNIELSEDDTKQLQMPYSMVKNDVESRFQAMISTLKEKLDERIQSKTAQTATTVSPTNSSTVSKAPDDVEDEMNNKLEQCKQIIQAQEAIIQGLRGGYTKEAFENALLTFGISSESYEEAERRTKLLKDEEKKFNEERKRFTEYVLKISKEREEFEKERVEFYMHCLSTPVMKKDKKLHQKAHVQGNVRMATPSFSPAPSQQQRVAISHASQQPPSTAELYKFMSLNYDSAVSRNLERNFDGSFVQSISTDDSPSPQKLQEHAANIRKAVEQKSKQNKSSEGEKTEESGPVFMMEP